MINPKITKTTSQQSNEERLFKLLEGIDWKLWEMYNMMKDFTNPSKKDLSKVTTEKTPTDKKVEVKSEKPKSRLAKKVAETKID